MRLDHSLAAPTTIDDSERSQERTSHYISKDEAIRFRDAALYAYCSGRPLNEFITIHYDRAKVSDRRGFRSTLCKLMGNWLARRCGFPACYVWTVENPPRWIEGRGGLHLHLLAHVPSKIRRQFRSRLGKWLEQAGGSRGQGAMKRKAINYCRPNSDAELYLRKGLWGIVRYLLKGVDPNVAVELKLSAENQGVIVGKRIGYSEALGEQHRWHAVPVPFRPGLFIVGSDSWRRHFANLVCPELLGLDE